MIMSGTLSRTVIHPTYLCTVSNHGKFSHRHKRVLKSFPGMRKAFQGMVNPIVYLVQNAEKGGKDGERLNPEGHSQKLGFPHGQRTYSQGVVEYRGWSFGCTSAAVGWSAPRQTSRSLSQRPSRQVVHTWGGMHWLFFPVQLQGKASQELRCLVVPTRSFLSFRLSFDYFYCCLHQHQAPRSIATASLHRQGFYNTLIRRSSKWDPFFTSESLSEKSLHSPSKIWLKNGKISPRATCNKRPIYTIGT